MEKKLYDAPQADRIVLHPEQCILVLSDPSVTVEDAGFEWGAW